MDIERKEGREGERRERGKEGKEGRKEGGKEGRREEEMAYSGYFEECLIRNYLSIQMFTEHL